MESLLKALQARKLDRIAAAYAVVGWLLVQAASIALPAFDLPAWSLRAFIIFVAAGFPATLLIAWFAAPHLPGHEGQPHPQAARRLAALAVVAGVFVLSAGEAAYWLADTRTATVAIAQAAPTPLPQAASIAVLPFDNMSGDATKAYFSDGISDEILNDLANVQSMRVAARASSFAFRSRNQDIKSVARTLAVRTILQGSVRESGQHIRVTAQLVNAADGYVIWSSSFDRDLTDVLSIQEEIARAITSALTHKLLPEDPKTKANRPIAMNAEAYRAYLEGQYALGPRTAEGNAKALELFKKVVKLQPDFAEGYAALGRAYINVAEDKPLDKTLMPAAAAALKRALELAPDNLSALASHLDLSLHLLDWTSAGIDAQRMQKINPNSAIVLHEMFRYYQLMGFPQQALDAARGAAQLDPLSIVDRLNIASAQMHMALYGDAMASAQDALALHRDQPYIQSMLCSAYAHSGRAEDARRIAIEFEKNKDAGDASGCRFDIAVGSGKRAEAELIMDRLAAKFPNGDLSATDLGDNYAAAGAYSKALVWLNRANDLREFALFTIPYDKAIAAEFFELPGWKTLWQKPLPRAWQAAHDDLAADLNDQRTGG